MKPMDMKLPHGDSNLLSRGVRKFLIQRYPVQSMKHEMQQVDTLLADFNDVRARMFTLTSSEHGRGQGAELATVYADYYGILCELERKFVFHKENVSVSFCWYDVLSSKRHKSKSIGFEKACTLWNYAAAISVQASKTDRSCVAGMSETIRLCFQCAGVLQYLHDKLFSLLIEKNDLSASEDLSRPVITWWIALMESQAAGFMFNNAHIKGMSASAVSKLAQGASEKFHRVETLTSQSLQKYFRSKGFPYQEYCSYKVLVYIAASQYFASAVEKDNEKHGVEIARLMLAQKVLQRALRTCPNVPGLVDAARPIQRWIEQRLPTAKKDNDSIYIAAIPPETKLPALEGRVIGSPTPFEEPVVDYDFAVFDLLKKPVVEQPKPEQTNFDLQLSLLASKGFEDHKQNLALLKKYDGDVIRAHRDLRGVEVESPTQTKVVEPIDSSEPYAEALSNLQRMGFEEKSKNVEALQKAKGKVPIAIELLLRADTEKQAKAPKEQKQPEAIQQPMVAPHPSSENGFPYSAYHGSPYETQPQPATHMMSSGPQSASMDQRPKAPVFHPPMCEAVHPPPHIEARPPSAQGANMTLPAYMQEDALPQYDQVAGPDPSEKYKLQLRELQEMGFADRERNLELLHKYDGDTQKALNMLLG